MRSKLNLFILATVVAGSPWITGCMKIRSAFAEREATLCKIFGCDSTDFISFLDPSFGSNGNYYLSYQNADSTYAGYVLTSDQKMVMALDRGAGNFALVRFTSNLQYDETFGTNGWVAISSGITSSTAISLRGKINIDANDNMYLGIEASPSTNAWDLMVMKLKKDGSVDTSFGSGGIATIDFSGGSDRIAAVTPLPSGKILVSGQVDDSGSTFMGTVRLSADGALDTAYGTAGKQTFAPAGDTYSTTYRSLENPDGVYLVGGSWNGSTFFTCTLVKLDWTGNIDTGFGTSGYASADVDPMNAGGFDICYSASTDSSGNIYAYGESDNGAMVMKVKPDGTLDTSYNAGSSNPGVSYYTVNSAQDWSHFGTTLSNGRVLSTSSASGWSVDVGLTLLNSDGSIDTTYVPVLNDTTFSSPQGGQFVRNLGSADSAVNGDAFVANNQVYFIMTTDEHGYQETVISRLNIQ